MDELPETPTRCRIDAMSGLMSMVTVAALIGAAWLRFGPSSSPESMVLTVGEPAPALRLLDLKTSDPLALIGLKSKVVWVVFWSAGSPAGRSCLAELAPAWRGLRVHRRFALVTAAIEAGDPGRVRTAVAALGVDLPVYLASRQTQRQYRAQHADPPLHVLIDAEGTVIATARGADRATIQRIADLARRRLDELDPLEPFRLASAASH